jgi:16S rRNA (guanine527-N7)-methyltransferase
MSEDEVRAILQSRFEVSRGTLDRLAAFVELVREGNNRQNLVAQSSLATIWHRHILDSAQLVVHAATAQTWLDLGTGAGFPGIIIAAIHPAKVSMVESRPLRADFLNHAADLMGFGAKVRIICASAEKVEPERHDVISARAFAPLDRLLDIGIRFAAPETRWVLPKGRSAQRELDSVRTSWQGMFHVEPSLTDPESGIIVAEQVSRKNKGHRDR